MERLENDMDDLFRKAGELYPLKITESDWDGVAGKLQEAKFGDEQTIPGANNIGTGNKRKWLFLLFLIPLGLAGLIYSSGIARKHSGSAAMLTVKSNPLPITGSVAKGSPAKKAGLSNRADQNQSADNETVRSAVIKSSDNKTFRAPAPTPKAPATNRIARGHSGLINLTGVKTTENRGSYVNQKSKYSAAHRVNIVKSEDPGSKISNENPDPSNFNKETFQNQLAKPLSLTAVSNTGNISVHGVPIRGNTTTLPENLKGSVKDADVKSAKGFYVGLLVGPDLSAVKFQSVKQLGFSLGAKVGYRFNRRLSVETGLLWDKKYYYSKGEYFDKSDAGLQFDILNLEGSCNMFEIPLAVRYDFSTHKNHNFFIKGGLSSYLMKKENYSYNAEGVYGPWQGDSTYYNSTNSIFSIVQLSAGYEFAVGKKTNISFEPYVKIPLHGIGIGDMPISSAGLYIGITHSFR
jgi:hypothetical protein